LDDTHVYWLSPGSWSDSTFGKVMKAPLIGGTPVTLYSGGYEDSYREVFNVVCGPPAGGGGG
jgi:hypothetical protein